MANARSKFGVNDLILLEDSAISNDGITGELKSHFQGNEIYTYIGQTLISVNPFKSIDGLYSNATLGKYKGKKEYHNPPHVYAVAERAYRNMVQELSNECVIISGESGAGKTEASKKVMEYISAANTNKSKDVQKVKEQLLESNPLLEAFGNAKTCRNNNSSRFGKYMEILFDISDPKGGRISVYLLEKSRVIHQSEGERNFHIFYQLLAAGDSNLGLGKDPSKFNYLNQGKANKITGVSDEREYAETVKAMKIIGFSDDQITAIFNLLGGVLHLGNVEFEAGDKGAIVKNEKEVEYAAKLLGLDCTSLCENLTHKEIKTAVELIKTPLDVNGARHARDSLAKSIYGRLFDWLVSKANESIHSEFYSNTIGVLDIYGFEIFEENSFEQLCINFVNEKLHQLFIELTLQAEQEEYKTEGITWTTIDYYNNKPICEMIEQRGGVFSFLDEESIFPRATDTTLFDKLKNQLSNKKEFIVPPKTRNTFAIKHYAGSVSYTTEGFLDKNRDLLFQNLIKMLTESKWTELHEMFESDLKKDDKKRPVTTCVQFKKSVLELMQSLRACNQHYIRCIKPNNSKRSGTFEDKIVLDQVKYLGLLENVKVRRAGYAYRLPFDKLVQKYKVCSKKHLTYNSDAKAAVKELMDDLGHNDYVLGKTKIFIKEPKTLFKLEDDRKIFLDMAASLVPAPDEFVFADKVVGPDAKGARVPVIFIISTQNCYIFSKDQKLIAQVTMEQLQGMTVGDGFCALHIQYPSQDKKNPEPINRVVVIENVFKRRILDVAEVIKNSGVEIDINESDIIPDASQEPLPKLQGTKVKRKKCTIM